MSLAPFQPSSTAVEIPEQLRRLWRKLADLDNVQTLPAGASLATTVAKVNEIVGKLKAITKG